MRSGFLRTILVLMLVLLATPAIVQARAVHFFPCEDCHQAGVSPTTITSNVCMSCHDVGSGSVMQNDLTMASANGRLSVGDASDRFNNNPSAAAETSHNWGATDNNPAAGASAPQDRYFYGRQSFSIGTVACSRCHDPHGDMDANPQLLKLPPNVTNPATSQPYVAEDMCLDCHRNWDVSTHGLNTHPLGVDLATAAGNIPDANNDPDDRYHDAPDNSKVANGGVALINGKVSCSTCHGVHHTDSDGSTVDGQGTAGVGDGLLLRHNGPGLEDIDTSICQTCHIYKLHGKDPLVQAGSMPLDCLDCHGGHAYDATDPNYFMLKKQVTVDTSNIKTGGGLETVTLNYGAGDIPDVLNRPVDFAGVCTTCHTLPGGHDAGWDCADCHGHDNTAGSFGPGCGSCHGFPPTVDADGSATAGGWANDPATGNRYDTSGFFKDESATPHKTHAAGAGDYVFGCDSCHGTGATSAGHATHNTGTFQDILDKAPGAPISLVTDGGNLAPVYTTSGAGTCSAVYCHSNGGPRGAVPATVAVSWENGLNTINSCNACHGDTAANMSSKGNSSTHGAHLNKFANDCSICHANTASSNAALLPSAIGGLHVNGVSNNGGNDLDFNATFELSPGNPLGGGSYGDTTGTCAVYCHTNGKGSAAVPAADWDDANTGNCGTCHQVNATGDTGPALTGAHDKHVFDADGPGLACTTCHSHADGNSADHVNGAFDYSEVDQAALYANVCNPCHGVDAVDNVEPAPVWTNAASMDCQTCHVDTLTTMAGAPDKSVAEDSGHNLASGSYPVTVNTAAALNCEACHDRTATGHLDAPGDKRLLAGFDCMSCHDGSSATLVDTHTNIGATIKTEADFTLLCLDCHDPHGHASNAGMVDVTNVVFTSRTLTDSFDEADAANADDICATCHTNTSHNNTAATGSHNEGADCMTCHAHGDAFMPTGGNSCEDCHSAKLAEPRHAAHINITNPDIDADKSDCAICHPSAAGYTITGGSPDHFANSANDFDANITDPLGATTTCSSAMGCHSSTAGDGFWQDVTGLNCNACHDAPPANGGGDGSAHADHGAAGIGCATCHGALPSAPDTTHITERTGADDAAVLTNMANAVADEANVAEASFDDGLNTCNNTACHNPSGGANVADWDTSTSSCNLCHSTTDPATGSHSEHMSAATNFGITPACTDCHTSAGGNMAHRDATVDFQAGFAYSGDATDFSNTTWGTCTTATCHNDGTGTPVPSPAWGTASADCTICHAGPPATGDHDGHYDGTRNDANHGLGCLSCHSGTAASDTQANGGNHLNSGQYDVVAGGNYDKDGAGGAAPVAVAFVYTQAATSTCTASCHSDTGRTFNWAPANSCNACHDAGGPADNIHAKHTTVTLQTTAEDRTDCAQCHPNAAVYAYDLSHADHGDGATTLAAGVTDLGGGDYSCNICHLSSAGDGNFADVDGLNCDACHYYNATPAQAANDSHTAPLSAGLDPSHSAHFAKSKLCSDCHTVPASGTGHITDVSGANQGAVLQGKAEALPAEAAVTRTNMTYNGGTNTCSGGGIALGCHATGSPVWNTTISTCTACHTDETTAAVNPTSGLHNAGTATRHDDSLAAGNCVNCHDGTSPSSAHQDGTLQDSTGATFTFHSNVDGYSNANGCASAACHTDGGDWNRKWVGAVDALPLESDAESAGVCDNCHGSFTSGWRFVNEGNATSTDHTDPSNVNVGDRMDDPQHQDCARCHGWGTGGYTGHHNDGSIATNSDLGYNNTTGTCALNCHNGDSYVMNTDSGWTNHNIAVGALNCGACHADGTLPPTSGSHAAHGVDADTDYTECESCHGTDNGGDWASGLGLHNNGSVDFAAGVTYSGGATGTCSTSACHSTATNTSTWGTAGSVGCDECHYYAASPTGAGNSGSSDPLSASHGAHFDSGKNCTDCHGTLPTDQTHITDVSGATDGAVLTGKANALQNEAAVTRANMTFTDAGNTCSGGTGLALGCHATGTPDWDDATTADNCTDCHTDETTATVNPTSGLHDMNTITRHDDTLDGGNCVNCHDGTSPSSLHQDGTLNNATQGSWTFNANVVGYSQANGCMAAVACHTDGGDWERKWTGVIDADPLATDSPGAAVCDNCHGDFSGWRSVNTSHTDPYTGNTGDQMNQHSNCQTCHGWGDAGYNRTWASGDHGDGFIKMNGPNSPLAGAGYNDTTGGCTAACHTESPFVMETASGWTVNYGDFGSGDCTSCHTGNGVTHGGAGGLALHNAHNASPYVDSNSNFVYGTSGTYDNCNTCHGHNGTGGHNNGTVEFVGAITAGSNYGTIGNFSSDNCTNTCHNNAAGEWAAASLGANSCTDCHAGGGSLDQGAYPPSSDRHGEHLGNANYIGGCTDCHTHSGSVAAADHVNTTVETGGAITGGTLPSCANTCHGITGDVWDNTKTAGLDLNCDDCHGIDGTGKSLYRDRTTGSHGSHVITANAPTTYGSTANKSSTTEYDFECGSCHAGSHLSGGVIEVTTPNWNGGTSSCSTNACHHDGTNGPTAFDPVWGSAFTGDRCTKCHGNSPASGAHSAHTVGIHSDDVYTGSNGLLASTGTEPSAHGGQTSGGAPTSTVINCQVCHFTTVTDWNNDQHADCAVCHDGGTASLRGDMTVGNKANHVDGTTDVVFFNAPVRSKAQLRNDIESVAEIANNWKRMNDGLLQNLFYKGANAYDETEANLNTGTFTPGATPSCTVACHNGNAATWVAPSGNCMVCHTELPQ